MKKAICCMALLLILCCGAAVAGEKEEVDLQIQVVQGHLALLNQALYAIPFEKKVYEDALMDLRRKRAALDKPAAKEEKKTPTQKPTK